jgi:CRP-like cAMP-binding protein
MSDAENLYSHLNKLVHISEHDAIILLGAATIRQLRKKEHLFIEGEVAKYVGFVNKGCLRYYRLDEKGEEHIIYFATEGWWIGDLSSFYSGKPSLFNLHALEDCELFLYTRDAFEKVRVKLPSFDQYVKIAHAKATDARVQSMTSQRFESAESRYLKLLYGFPDIFQRVPQHYIASYLGIQPQSLSRIRKKIAEKGKEV